MMLIHLIAAARPNFMKISPLYHELKKEPGVQAKIVHTGQHYDLNMSDAFFRDLRMPKPDIHLEVGSGTHAEQTGKVMIAYEKKIIEKRPDLVIVVGDVNSTAAATIAAVKLGVKVAHLEAGLRSFDRTMPEEINRIITDVLVDILWTPSEDADKNLLNERISRHKIIRVGNIMIDSLEMLRKKIERQKCCDEFGLIPDEYGLVTLHRPSNVDNPNILRPLCQTLKRISETHKLVFPVHPRTQKNLAKEGLISVLEESVDLILLEPLNYIRFMNLVFNCRFVITDSGGIQEETTYLGIPCLTLRPNTERPITLAKGTNRLCSLKNIEDHLNSLLTKDYSCITIPELWDGKTAPRVVSSITKFFN